MIALLQRVTGAEVRIGGRLAGSCSKGLLVLFCAEKGDDESLAAKMAQKTSKLRIFGDEDGRMNRSVLDVGGSVLVVSQFTLAADTRSGNRPGFSLAADPETGKRLYEDYVRELRSTGLPVETGEFGADMRVTLTNDGPVTIPLRLQAKQR